MVLPEADQQIADLVATNAAVQLMLRYCSSCSLQTRPIPRSFERRRSSSLSDGGHIRLAAVTSYRGRRAIACGHLSLVRHS